MQLQWSCAVPSGYSVVAQALARFLVTNLAACTTDVAVTRLAAIKTGTEQIESSVCALVATTSLNVLLAAALTALHLASVQSADRSVRKAVALLAAVGVARAQIPVERTTLIANSPLNSFLALTQLTDRHKSASFEAGNDTCWMTIARLAKRVIVEVLLAHIAGFAIEASLAVTLTVAVAGNSHRSVGVAVARQAGRVLVEARHALIAAFARKVAQARALSVVVADLNARTRC